MKVAAYRKRTSAFALECKSGRINIGTWVHVDIPHTLYVKIDRYAPGGDKADCKNVKTVKK